MIPLASLFTGTFIGVNALLGATAMWLLAIVDPLRIWYAVPIIVSVSLVYAATRNELMGPILINAARFGLWILAFMGILFAILQFMSWLQ